MRRMALAGLGIASLATTSLLIFVLYRWVQGEALTGLLISLTAVLILISGGFGYTALVHSTRFVTHLELWPQSQLAHIRTAGLFSESIHLVSWQEFRARKQLVPSSDRDPYYRIRLRSGLRLTFEHINGRAPMGWVALHRFLEKCSIVPHAKTSEINSSRKTKETPEAIGQSDLAPRLA